MRLLKTALLASSLVVCVAFAASAQSAMTKNSPKVSSKTHCLDANGTVQLKSAMKKSGSGKTLGMAGTAGTRGTGGASGSTSTGVGTNAGAMAASSLGAQNLPSCNK